MNRPTRLWPPNGGEPIAVLPQKVAQMERKGWTQYDPQAMAAARALLTDDDTPPEDPGALTEE